MAESANCTTHYEFLNGDGVTVTSAGAGRTYDPEQVIISANISSEANQAIQVRPDGSLFVDAVAAGNGLSGAVTAFNQSYPINGNNELLINLEFDDGQTVPFSPSTGTWVIPNFAFPSEASWPLDCDISDGRQVYRDTSAASTLYVDPGPRLLQNYSFQSAVNYSNNTYSAGDLYNQILQPVSVFSPCGRDVLVTVTADFGGFEAQVQGNDELRVRLQLWNPVAGVWETQTTSRIQASGFDLASTLFLTGGENSFTRLYEVPSSSLAGFQVGMRYQVASVVGNVSVGSNITSQPIFPNWMTVTVQEVE